MGFLKIMKEKLEDLNSFLKDYESKNRGFKWLSERKYSRN